MCNIESIGADWILERATTLPFEMVQLSPVEFNEQNRYLPQSVSPNFPGYIRFDSFPYWKEIIDSMDVRSPVREGYVKKGAQIAYTTGMECVVFYAAAHIRTVPMMYVTADKELADARIELNFMPMFQQSGFGDIFQSSDEGSRKTGKTKERLQWVGGGFLVPQGARNADKMRQFTVLFLVLDEVEAWPDLKNEGDPVQLIRERTGGLDMSRKILIGSSPLIKGSSRIDALFERGDQRIYKVRCLKCGYPQPLRWSGENKETGKKYGFAWDFDADGVLDLDSCRYHCKNCNEAHFEHDKPKLIHEENAFWTPTAKPREPNIRSWHIPSMLSPFGGRPWSRCVSMWLAATDRETGRVTDADKLQVFYNNVLGESFEIYAGRIRFESASAHRRTWYRKGQVPNTHVGQYCDSPILFLTMTVDCHKNNLAVAVWGWAQCGASGFTCWLVNYFRLMDESENGTVLMESPVWAGIQKLIDDGVWTADDGKKYRLAMTFIDAAWGESSLTVVEFCAQWEQGVYPIMGRERPQKSTAIQEFKNFTTQAGTTGYLITVDHYKDRLAPVLRRTWRPDEGKQEIHTFNAPVDTTDDELRELTREVKRKKKIETSGQEVWYWHRPGNAPQELWDLMVYGHASVEILAWLVCRSFDLEITDWLQFWEYCKSGVFYEV